MTSPSQISVVRRGLMLVLSSPSGAGKSTLAQMLLREHPEIHLSVSVTTRERRPSEVEGIHYHFIRRERFEKLRDVGDLLESAEVHGNFYGTPREPVENALAAGKDVLFDIDYQGTLQLYENMRSDIVGVFILPPSAGELKTRLERRAEDASGVIEKRLKNARTEIAHWREYDYVLVNEDLNATFINLQAILTAERLRRERQLGLAPVVERLDQELATLTS
ncbi:guanylate kinase [Ancylobacter dichloromethanicus]|uniref:Guanylate kinase n=1 Tax=Ancylobacter dichloromethanicus TaxID=518825 RepID=A0A9W6J8S6_9HYPH|nr:guanylate kinase [Ancylobacter dichloromethanicus]MBS7555726.1 guanylate kinase [Ancylobacter dichloromethanicus]GLK72797.1 guanylate kinase [Ancylobacter dichloromethanicus]